MALFTLINQHELFNLFVLQYFTFKASLTDLMEKMLGAEPQFVRCVKPNNLSRHGLFEGPIVQRQLKYTGVLETIKIRRQGFPTRLLYADFLQR